MANSSFSPIAQMRYMPYGVSRDSTDDAITDYLFTSQQLDASIGLYWYGSRAYDPELGRFTCADTIVPSPGNPQSLNRYAYTQNNPLRYVDSSGHAAVDGQTLWSQSPEIQRMFEGTWGGGAAARWEQEHNAELEGNRGGGGPGAGPGPSSGGSSDGGGNNGGGSGGNGGGNDGSDGGGDSGREAPTPPREDGGEDSSPGMGDVRDSEGTFPPRSPGMGDLRLSEGAFGGGSLGGAVESFMSWGIDFGGYNAGEAIEEATRPGQDRYKWKTYRRTVRGQNGGTATAQMRVPKSNWDLFKGGLPHAAKVGGLASVATQAVSDLVLEPDLDPLQRLGRVGVAGVLAVPAAAATTALAVVGAPVAVVVVAGVVLSVATGVVQGAIFDNVDALGGG